MRIFPGMLLWPSVAIEPENPAISLWIIAEVVETLSSYCVGLCCSRFPPVVIWVAVICLAFPLLGTPKFHILSAEVPCT